MGTISTNEVNELVDLTLQHEMAMQILMARCDSIINDCFDAKDAYQDMQLVSKEMATQTEMATIIFNRLQEIVKKI